MPNKIINSIAIWWLTWLFISMFSFTGLNKPALESFFYVVAFVFFFYIGSKCVFISSKKSLSIKYKPFDIRKFKFGFRIFFIIVFIIVVPVAIFSTSKLLTMPASEYRILIFKSSDEGGALLGSDRFNLIYTLFIRPLIWILIAYGLWLQNRTNEAKYLWLPLIIGTLDSLIFFGRFFFYEYFIALYFIGIMNTNPHLNKNIKNLKIKKEYIFLLLAMTVIFFTVMTNDELLILKIFEMLVVDYHTIGFIFFSEEVTNLNSFSNMHIGFGSGTLMAIYRYITLILHYIFPTWEYPDFMSAISYRNEFVNLSNDGSNVNVYNAYYTILTTFYYDGRLVGIAIGAFMIGLALKYFLHQYTLFKNLSSFIMILLISQMMIFSIFQSRIEFFMVQSMFIYIWILFNKIKLR